MSEDRIESIINRASVKAEIEATKKEVADLVALIKSVKGTALNISGAKSAKEFNDLKKELDAAVIKTDALTNSIVTNTKAQADAAKAAELMIQKKKAEEQAAIDAAKSIEYQTKKQEELNAAMESAARSGNKRAQLVQDPAEIQQAANSVTVYADELEKLTGTIDENQKLHGIYTSELADVDNKLKVLKKTTDDSAKGSKKYQDELAGLTSRQKQLKGDLADVNKTLGLQIKENNSAAGSIDKLRARYALLLREIERGGTAFQASSPGKLIAAEAVVVKTALDKAERQALLFRGSLSNTGSVIIETGKKAFGALRTLANILPGFGISGLLLFAFEGISSVFSSTSKKAEELKEKLKDLIKPIEDIKDAAIEGASGDLGKVNALSAAVLDQTKSYKERNAALEQLKEINKNYFGDLTVETAQLGLLKQAVDDYTKAIIVNASIKAFSDEIGKVNAEISKQTRELDRLNTQTETYKKNVDKVNAANATNVQGVTGQNRAVNLATNNYNNASVAARKQADAVDKLKIQYADLEEAINGAVAESLKLKPLQTPGGGKGTETQAKFYDDLLKRQRDAFLEISKEEDRHIAGRIFAREEAFKKDKEILEGQQAVNIINAKGNAKEINRINELAAFDLVKIEADKNKDILKLQDKFYNDTYNKTGIANKLISKSRQEQAEADTAHRVAEHEIELQSIKNLYDADLIALDDKYAKGLIKEKEYNEEKLRLQLALQKDLVKEDIAFTKTILELAKVRAGLTGSQADKDKVAKAEEDLRALELKLLKIGTDAHLEANAKKKKSDKELFDAKIKQLHEIAEISSAVLDTISGFIGANADKEKNKIQEQIDALDKKKEKDIEVANQTIVNAQERAAAITAIELTAQAKKEALERRQRQLDEQRARFEKAATVFRLSLALAEAIASLNPLRIIAAIGQLAVAIATPVPKFKYGGTHKGGLAEVGDGGKAEGIELPDGTVIKSPSHSTIMDLPAGTKIHPDFSKMMINATMTKVPEYSKPTQPDGSVKVVKELKEVKKAITKIPQTQITVQNAISQRIRYGRSINDHLTRNLGK